LLLLCAGPARSESSAPVAAPGAAKNAAVRRAAGAAFLSLGAVMIPTSTAWYLAKDDRGAATGSYAGWQVTSQVLAASGGVLLVHGQRTRGDDGPSHPAARGLRIFGGILVAGAAVLMPIGVLALENDLGGGFNQAERLDAGVGILSVAGGFLAGGIAMVAAGAYYDSSPSMISIGASPITGIAADGRSAWLGAVATVTGRF